ncbi:c-type cytochrome domain-containing protein [Chthoniobacter flavus]|uniref:c-type cytochrome domain-containing protein n=1 Tax=Chthoniobacter flavus TaxID=191863 RepID=UPI00192C6267
MKRSLLLLPLLLFAHGLCAAEVDVSKLPPPAARPVDFAKDVRPLFEKYCFKCHGPEKQKSGYRLDVQDVALKGGDDHAPNIVPGKSAESPLIHFVAGLDEDMLMPQKGERLTAEQISLLRAWIDQGANWPMEAQASDPRKTHWSFCRSSDPRFQRSRMRKRRCAIRSMLSSSRNWRKRISPFRRRRIGAR